MNQTPGDSPTGLQFDRAEYASAPVGLACANCRQEITQTYYEANGKTLCERCRYAVADFMSSTPGASGFIKAAGAGAGAAGAGAIIYYLVLIATDRIFGLIAILVGYMVGRAVRWGTANRGGWRCQALAIVLTYVAIVSAYAPLLFKGMADAGRQQSAQTAPPAAGTPTAAAPASAAGTPSGQGTASPKATGNAGGAAPATQERAQAPGLGGCLLGLGVVGAILLASPFLGGFDPIGWAIIAFGLYQAWTLNKRVYFEISGPFTAGTARAS